MGCLPIPPTDLLPDLSHRFLAAHHWVALKQQDEAPAPPGDKATSLVTASPRVRAQQGGSCSNSAERAAFDVFAAAEPALTVGTDGLRLRLLRALRLEFEVHVVADEPREQSEWTLTALRLYGALAEPFGSFFRYAWSISSRWLPTGCEPFSAASCSLNAAGSSELVVARAPRRRRTELPDLFVGCSARGIRARCPGHAGRAPGVGCRTPGLSPGVAPGITPGIDAVGNDEPESPRSACANLHDEPALLGQRPHCGAYRALVADHDLPKPRRTDLALARLGVREQRQRHQRVELHLGQWDDAALVAISQRASEREERRAAHAAPRARCGSGSSSDRRPGERADARRRTDRRPMRRAAAKGRQVRIRRTSPTRADSIRASRSHAWSRSSNSPGLGARRASPGAGPRNASGCHDAGRRWCCCCALLRDLPTICIHHSCCFPEATSPCRCLWGRAKSPTPSAGNGAGECAQEVQHSGFTEHKYGRCARAISSVSRWSSVDLG